MEDSIRNAKKVFSWIAFCIFITGVISLAVSIIMSKCDLKYANFVSNKPLLILMIILPSYLISFPVGMLLMLKFPAEKREKLPSNIPLVIKALLACIPVMYLGSIIGVLVNSLSGVSNTNPVQELVNMLGSYVGIFLVAVICAPIFEELLFRKFIIDRVRRFGEVPAVFFSALAFGLFHMNFAQFFYAFMLGLIFGYVYVRSGKIHYTMILHATINFLGSVVPTFIIEKANINEIQQFTQEELASPEILQKYSSQFAIIGLYALVILALIITGIVIICLNAKKLQFAPTTEELPKGQRLSTAFINLGFILLFILCLAMIFIEPIMSALLSFIVG